MDYEAPIMPCGCILSNTDLPQRYVLENCVYFPCQPCQLKSNVWMFANEQTAFVGSSNLKQSVCVCVFFNIQATGWMRKIRNKYESCHFSV